MCDGSLSLRRRGPGCPPGLRTRGAVQDQSCPALSCRDSVRTRCWQMLEASGGPTEAESNPGFRDVNQGRTRHPRPAPHRARGGSAATSPASELRGVPQLTCTPTASSDTRTAVGHQRNLVTASDSSRRAAMKPENPDADTATGRDPGGRCASALPT